MKKSIFMLAAMFAATFANAQIALEGTINLQGCTVKVIPYFSEYYVTPYVYNDCGKIPVECWDSKDGYFLALYNTDGSLYKKVNKNWAYDACLFSKNIFTKDNKIAFLAAVPMNDGSDSRHLCCINEDGQLIYDFGEDGWILERTVDIRLINNEYKLLRLKTNNGQFGDNRLLEIYSLPGNGETQDIETPVVQRSSARKVLKKDQVLVENADKTYTLQGQEVK